MQHCKVIVIILYLALPDFLRFIPISKAAIVAVDLGGLMWKVASSESFWKLTGLGTLVCNPLIEIQCRGFLLYHQNHTNSCSVTCTILCTVPCGMCSSPDARRTGFWGLLSNASCSSHSFLADSLARIGLFTHWRTTITTTVTTIMVPR